jgi:hypothetical protein
MTLKLIEFNKSTTINLNTNKAPIPIADYWLIPAGAYEAQCIKAYIYYDKLYRREILCLSWKIVEGEHYGKVFPEFINYSREKVGLKSKLHKEFVKILGEYPSAKCKLVPEVFKNILCAVEIVPSVKSHDQKEQQTKLPYSVVNRIIKRLIG